MGIEEINMNLFIEKICESYDNNSIIKTDKQIEDFALFQNECMYLFDFTQNEIIYKKGFKNVLGYSEDEITTDFLFNNIHPDDADILNRIVRAAIVYCLEHPNYSMNNLLSIKYRRKKRDGTYINVLSQSSIYQTDERGKLSIGLARFSDVSFMGNCENVKWSFKASNIDNEAFRKEVYRSYQDFFTKREMEIIVEIENGHTNSEIAEKFNISEHTVATHRKHILKKSNCHNSEGLILFCKDKCII
ncbi:MAG: LuxR C-terminal-related transcriptional regulator [Bacteroidota bacterium]